MTCKTIYVAIGIDCDPDRDVYPDCLAFRGLEATERLLNYPSIKWTLNIRADQQIMRRYGDGLWCFKTYANLLNGFKIRGHQIAWHLHYYDNNDIQSTSHITIDNNIVAALNPVIPSETIHMGWLYQDDYSLMKLASHGVKIDYSPAPGMKMNRGTDNIHDWSGFAYRPQVQHGIKMIPAFTYYDPLLNKRFKTERVLLHPTFVPFLFKRFLGAFFRASSDYLVMYFHADELIPALGDYRNRLYGADYLKVNLSELQRMASQKGFEIEYVTISELAEVLF